MLGVPEVLLADRDEYLVHQRIAEPRYLVERACEDVWPAIGTVQTGALPGRRRPDADSRPPRRGHPRDRHLDGDRVHVEELGRVDAVRPCPALRDDVEVLERSQVPKLKDGAEVHVEALG